MTMSIVCCSKYYKTVIFVIKPRFHEGRRSPAIIWLCLWFSSIWYGKIYHNFCNLWNLSCRSFKSRKKAVSSPFAILCFLVFFLYLTFGLMNFFSSTGTTKGTICLTVQKILRNSTERNAINLARKIPIFFVSKHYT